MLAGSTRKTCPSIVPGEHERPFVKSCRNSLGTRHPSIHLAFQAAAWRERGKDETVTPSTTESTKDAMNYCTPGNSLSTRVGTSILL